MPMLAYRVDRPVRYCKRLQARQQKVRFQAVPGAVPDLPWIGLRLKKERWLLTVANRKAGPLAPLSRGPRGRRISRPGFLWPNGLLLCEWLPVRQTDCWLRWKFWIFR
jgi:hypothetical protein